MKKLASTLVMAAAISGAISTTAHADTLVGVSVGSTSLEMAGFDLGSSMSTRYSIEFIDQEAKSAVGLRAALTNMGSGFDYDASATMLGADLVYRNRITQNGDLLVSAGLGRMELERTMNMYYIGNTKVEQNGIAVQGSIGYRHHFGKVSVQGDITKLSAISSTLDADATTFAFGVNYSF